MDDSTIAKGIRDALESLNNSLRQAYDAGLTVEIDSVSHQEISRYGDCRVYVAKIERRQTVA